ncbi:MAG TPA: COX15/CtaA family protein [Polyangiaceae bacterium]|nr:COX15/CtaA family protein [Polyangiaceae bacterium]
MAAQMPSPPPLTADGAAPLVSLGGARDPRSRFARFSRALLGYTLGVILFGAAVRITDSGAGCGQHWPTCNGDVLHVPKSVTTLIELTHRVTSGLSVLAILALLIGAYRLYPRGHSVRASAVFSFVMILVEALIGMLIVLMRWVVHDASFGRILALPLHLVSTSLLTAALAWCAYFASVQDVKPVAVPRAARSLLWLAGFGILLVSATGAVTALGDTVYPVQASGFAARIQEDQGLNAHLLQRMRSIHPFVAVLVAAFVAYVAMLLPSYRSSNAVRRASMALAVSIAVQLFAGVLNVFLSAPGPLQVVHLLIANIVWISLIFVAAALRQGEALAGTSVRAE